MLATLSEAVCILRSNSSVIALTTLCSTGKPGMCTRKPWHGMVLAELELWCKQQSQHPVLQVDRDGAVEASNFEMTPRCIAWKQCARNMLHRTYHASCTEHSVEQSYALQKDTNGSVMHGQLASFWWVHP